MTAEIVVTDATPVNLAQKAGSNRLRVIDVSRQSVPFWQANAYVPASGLMRPSDANQTGFVYKNAAAVGQTGLKEPAWPISAGGTVTDGSLTWTAAVPPATGQDTVASATWIQQSPPDGALTIGGQSTTPLTASAEIGGGTPGNVYNVLVTVTMTSTQAYTVLLVIAIQ